MYLCSPLIYGRINRKISVNEVFITTRHGIQIDLRGIEIAIRKDFN